MKICSFLSPSIMKPMKENKHFWENNQLKTEIIMDKAAKGHSQVDSWTWPSWTCFPVYVIVNANIKVVQERNYPYLYYVLFPENSRKKEADMKAKAATVKQNVTFLNQLQCLVGLIIRWRIWLMYILFHTYYIHLLFNIW